MNIIADIAGQYDALMRLVKIMPDEEFILVGDIIDRGPQSKEVVEWAMKHSRTILANHEHMMVDSYLHHAGNFYQPQLWETYNGGVETIRSYAPELSAYTIISEEVNWRSRIPENHIKWMAANPLYIKEDGVFISHAAKHKRMSIDEACDIGRGFYKTRVGKSGDSLLWNIGDPGPMDDHVQIYGHHANEDGPKYYTRKFPNGIFVPQDDAFAIAIDCSFGKKLTGINWPSREVFQVPYQGVRE